MNRTFIREKIEETLDLRTERSKIGVAGMSRGAGATFVAASLAKILSGQKEKRVTFLEICGIDWVRKPLVYDSLGMDKRFEGREFIRFYEEVKSGRNIKGRRNLDERINWVVASPEDLSKNNELTSLERLRLINNVSGDTIVCDIGDCEDREECLKEMDIILFVIDPLPSALFSGYLLFQEVKRMALRGKTVLWVINKFNAGINKRDILDFLRLKEYYKLPMLDADKFYAAEYNCKIPYEVREVKEKIKDTMEEIAKKHILITEM